MKAKERADAGIVTIQLGDLANCVLSDGYMDVEALQYGEEMFDVLLVGNHEHPYWGGPEFSGFYEVPEVKHMIRRMMFQGRYQPSVLVAGYILCTHAGVTPEWGWETAEEANEAILNEWELRGGQTSNLTSKIGFSRGGRDKYGGILWSDFVHEPRARFAQIHGHTVCQDGPRLWRNGKQRTLNPAMRTMMEHYGLAGSLNLDIGGGKDATRMVGAWVSDQGQVKIVEWKEKR